MVSSDGASRVAVRHVEIYVDASNIHLFDPMMGLPTVDLSDAAAICVASRRGRPRPAWPLGDTILTHPEALPEGQSCLDECPV